MPTTHQERARVALTPHARDRVLAGLMREAAAQLAFAPWAGKEERRACPPEITDLVARLHATADTLNPPPPGSP